MKRWIALMLVFVLGVMLCACGGGKSTFNPRTALQSKIQADAATYCFFHYSNVTNVMVSLSSVDNDGDIYTARGKVTVISNGSNYVGDFDAKYTLNGESFAKNSLNIGDLKKQ